MKLKKKLLKCYVDNELFLLYENFQLSDPFRSTRCLFKFEIKKKQNFLSIIQSVFNS